MSRIPRRDFFFTLSASALAPTLLGATLQNELRSSPPPQDFSSSRLRVELNGQWQRSFGGQTYDVVTVPSSLRPSGVYTLSRTFALPLLQHGMRAILHFDAVNYTSNVSVNGVKFGSMGPYTPFEFEITSALKQGENQIELQIGDLEPLAGGEGRAAIALGVNPGWEAYGGIIRDVYVELRAAVFIDNVSLGYRLGPELQSAECQATVYINAAERGSSVLEVLLVRNDHEIARHSLDVQFSSGVKTVEIPFSISEVDLWSPEAPCLYRLEVRLTSPSSSDRWACRTGFRQLDTVGRQFRLNGRPLALQGVCRHDMWQDEGFTLTREQQRRDMHMIKALGCNYVRLVHYPHDRAIIDLADELGLLVTEEPGYWNMNFADMPESEIELGYQILERTIRRDWNAPSVFGWLLSNECEWTVEVLAEGKRRCNAIDPLHRFVSAANSRPKEVAKPIYEKAGMDFFDQHPYTFDMNDFATEADFFGSSKPLTFSEWGGKEVAQSAAVMAATVDRLLDLTESGKLAGHCFWSWQDVRQYTRIDLEDQNGLLESGVVTEGREPRNGVYMELERLFDARRHLEPMPETRPAVLPLRKTEWASDGRFEPVALQDQIVTLEATRSFAAFEVGMAKYWRAIPSGDDQWERTGGQFRLWPQTGRDILISRLPFAVPSANGAARPLIASNVSPLTIPVGKAAKRLHILGHAIYVDDYPAYASFGTVLATLTIRFDSGSSRQMDLRNGYEVARANTINGATRTEVISLQAQPALRYLKDCAREDYQFLLYSTPLLPPGIVESVHYTVAGDHDYLAILAVTAEQL
jgi:Glycosyl hydrolases family 2, TIM barrel domain/Glycosyl hydrolases family 2/Glycosyl hydrolases family 2, sugar binding domain